MKPLEEMSLAAVLREGEDRYHFLADAVPLVIWTAKPDGCIDYYNKTWFDYTGLSLAETENWGWRAVIHPDDLQRCIDRWTHSFTTGEDYQIEYRFKRGSDGTHRWFLGRASARRDEAGAIVQWVGTCTDIDDQKRAEGGLRNAQLELATQVAERTVELQHSNQALQAEVAGHRRAERELTESNEKFRQLTDNIADVFWIRSPDMRELHYVSPAFARIWGRPVGSLYAHPERWLEYAVPEDRERLVNVFAAMANGALNVEVEYRIMRPDGEIRWVRTRGFQVRNAAGGVVRLVGIVSDITESKRTEEILQRQKAELQVLFDIIPAMIWFKDTSNNVLRVNERAAKAAGKTVAEIEGRASVENYPEDAAKFYADDLAVIQSGVQKLGIVESLPGPNGGKLWVQTDKVPFRDQYGNVTGIVVMAHDVTERKRVEESLRLLSSAVEQSTESILITEANLNWPGPKIVFVNPAFTRMTGYAAAEVMGKTPRVLQGPRTSRDVLGRLRQSLDRGDVFEGETTNYRKDGTEYEQEWQIAPIRTPAGKVTHYVALQRDVTARKRIEEALRESETRYRGFFEQAAVGVAEVAIDGHFVLINQRFADIAGRTREELLGCTFQEITHPDDLANNVESLRQLHAGEISTYTTKKRYLRKDGATVWVNLTVSLIAGSSGQTKHFLAMAVDITESKQLEGQLFQSQKLETVGKLAGGIAHEFNSIMTAIIGQSELLLAELPGAGAQAAHAIEIRAAAERAAVLTRQLLAYGRKQILQPKVLDLNIFLAGMTSTIRNLVGPGVEVRLRPGSGLKAVKIDPGQMEQVVVNLAMNAADAMPNGGKLTLETASLTFQPDDTHGVPDLKAGDYVKVAMTDTGTGMSELAKGRAFEPFFTTKGVGEGTGLGLSTCYGIIKQSGGHISIDSVPGHGTTFNLYLPQIEATAPNPGKVADPSELPKGSETILLVEEDPDLREMSAGLLRRLGYTVLAVGNDAEAVRLILTGESRPVDLLLMEVGRVQPGGRSLPERLKDSEPNLRIIHTTTHTEDTGESRGPARTGGDFLLKPFTPSALARKVRHVLDAKDEFQSLAATNGAGV